MIQQSVQGGTEHEKRGHLKEGALCKLSANYEITK